jgi:hypothetical protein
MAPAERRPHWSLDFPTRWGTTTFHLAVGAFLDDQLPGSWRGRGEPTPWPPRSPDMSSLTSCSGGLVKDCRPPVPQPLPELPGRISNAAAQVEAAVQQRQWEGIHYRLDVCYASCGAHVKRVNKT